MTDLSNYIVYAYAPAKDGHPTHGFQALRVKDASIQITEHMAHATIRKMEMAHPAREYLGQLQPGSFNFRIIKNCPSMEDAIKGARHQGLAHEPIRTCLGRYKAAQEAAAALAAKAASDKDKKEVEDLLKMTEALKNMFSPRRG